MEKYSILKTYFHILIIFTSFCLTAQNTPKDTTQLGTITLKTKAQTISDFVFQTIDSKRIQSNDGVILTPILNQIPGVLMQQGALNTNRITIRGIGGRSQYSTNRIKLYLNNVPLTNANGESVLGDFDLNSLGNVQITKGPKSTVYGANLGGVIQLKTRDKDNGIGFNTGMGSYDRYQFGFETSEELGKTKLQAFFNHLQSHEFRDNADYERQNLNILSKTQLNDNWQIENFLIMTRLKAFIPSSISRDDFENNPQVAAGNWFQSAGFESYEKILAASTLKHDLNAHNRWTTSVYFNHRDGFEPRPFDILDEKETGFGMRSQLSSNFNLIDKPLKTNIGFEFQTETYEAQNYDNLYRNTPERGSIQGELVNAFDQDRTRFNAFATADYKLHPKFDVQLGLNINFSNYKTQDRFLEDGLDQSSKLSYDAKLLPNLNLHYNISKNWDVFANYSIGIATPGIDESLDDQGFFNSNLNPSFGQNFEFSSKWQPLRGKFDIQLNLYQMNIEDLIVARRVEEDRFVGINAGKSRHRGLEFMLNYYQNLSADLNINWFTNFTYNDFKFTDFVDEDEDYSGHNIPAIPEYDFQIGFNAVFKQNWIANLNSQFVGQIPLNDANSLYTDTYKLFNFKLTYQTLLFQTQSQFSFGVNNIFDEHYAASVLPNAIGFGNSQPRYFYPGMPRQFYLKVLVNYKL